MKNIMEYGKSYEDVQNYSRKYNIRRMEIIDNAMKNFENRFQPKVCECLFWVSDGGDWCPDQEHEKFCLKHKLELKELELRRDLAQCIHDRETVK
jgi:hypothetical protein